MGSRPVIIRFCDKCQKELIGRLTLHTCPCCGKDICVSCQTREDNKHKPRERKPKVEPDLVVKGDLVGSVVEKSPPSVITLAPKKRGRKAIEALLVHATPPLGKPDISTFSIKTPEPNSSNPHYTLSLDGVGFACLTLKEGAIDLLRTFGVDQKFVENAPESEGKRNLLNILK